MTDRSGVYVLGWKPGTITMRVNLPDSPLLSDGTSQRGSVVAALQAWNAHLGTVQFASVPGEVGSYSLGNRQNEIAVDSSFGDREFGTNVLAVTVSYGTGNSLVESDIIFNAAYTWDSYRGNLGPTRDIRRVAMHEIGHVLGLGHPDEAGQNVAAIMNSRISGVDQLLADDIAGGQALYGAPGARPANDDFGAAIDFVLSGGYAQVSGTNIGATEQAGEPALHSQAPGRRTVWWRWTAPGKGSVVLSTLGSNFDTLLGVYTGSSVAALSLVGLNDDEESPSQNPTPSRKRTSRVEFAAEGGTVYHFAVDGWDGAMGQIRLSVDFVHLPVPRPPTFDAEEYLRRSPDVALLIAGLANRLDRAWAHYLETGVYQGRTDGEFDVAAYLAQYSELQTQFGANLAEAAIHWYATGRPSGLRVPSGFDVQSYFGRYPERAVQFANDLYGAWLHYRDVGVYEGEVYDELFRPEEYLALYPELLAALDADLKKALLHWLNEGRIEGRLGRIPLEFDAAGYFERNPDVANAVGGNLILGWQHFWAYGIYEGRAYDEEFRAFEYLALNEDLHAAFLDDWRGATLHWLRYGRIEGRLGRVPPIFDVDFYLEEYPDVGAVFGDYPTTVFQHYYFFGVYEGRIFDEEFRVDEYIALNPDLQAVFGTDRRGAFMHWVRWGRSEGRPGRNP